jgi:hypothetical protein
LPKLLYLVLGAIDPTIFVVFKRSGNFTRVSCENWKNVAHFAQRCGSGDGIRYFFDPWIRDGKKSGSGMNISDHYSQSLETVFIAKNTQIV